MDEDQKLGSGSSFTTRRAALGVTAAMTAGLLAEKALSPDLAHAEGVSSVNGKTGIVVLTASNVEAVPASELSVLTGESMGVGENALMALKAASKAEQEKHRGNTAVGWHALKNLAGTAGTSTEDNTAIGSQAGGALTTGGGNTMVGENAGVNLTSGQENVAIGCESLAHQQTVTGNVAVGFMACWANTTGTPNCALGYQALEQNTTGSYNVAMGDHTLQAGVGEEYNTAIGHYSLNKATAGAEENTALGAFCMKSVTTGKQNLAVGAFTGDKLTTGSQNVFIGSEAGLVNVTGSGNIYIGVGAGKAATGSNELIVANNGTTPLISGTLSGTQKLGFFGVTPVVKPAKATTVAEVVTALESLGLMA